MNSTSQQPTRKGLGLVGPTQTFECKLCSKKFTSNFCRKLHSHFHLVNGKKCEKSLKRCASCNKSFEKESVYIFHKRHFHRKKKSCPTTTFFPSWFVGDEQDSASREDGQTTVLRINVSANEALNGKPCRFYVTHDRSLGQ